MAKKKWHEVYEDERAFFIGRDGRGGLVRSQYDFRSVEALARESGLTVERVRVIVAKYIADGVIVPSPDKPGFYGYSHRVCPGE
jgi:hypothetical protein